MSTTQESGVHPTRWIVLSVLTLLFCLPLGVVGLIFAARASSFVGRADLEAARKSLRVAKWLFWVSIVGTILGYIAMVLIIGGQRGM
jgi:hypothetical protein